MLRDPRNLALSKKKMPKPKGPAISLFDQRTNRAAVREAMDFADAGGIALHIWVPDNNMLQRAPTVFRINRNLWAHLIDMDAERLVKLARSFGVRVIKLEREGRRGQHIDLCGMPLQRAMAIAKPAVGKGAPAGASS